MPTFASCNGSVHINEPDFAGYPNIISPNDSYGDICYISQVLTLLNFLGYTNCICTLTEFQVSR